MYKYNVTYISERLQESLRPVSECALTTVVAPMGYGKTTALNWFLSEKEKKGGAEVVRISVYSGNLTIFWKSVRDAFSHSGYDFLSDYPMPSDEVGSSILTDDLCYRLQGEKPVYVFIDDFHLMTDQRVSNYICKLADRLPDNVHLIVAGRDRFLPAAEILRLGNKVYQIGYEKLSLNHTELMVYAKKCGVSLSEEEAANLLYSSEGWFSAIYLNLRTLGETGKLPDRNSDIYSIFSAALIDPLPEDRKKFLFYLGLADEFTLEMAEYITGNRQIGDIIKTLTRENAFVNHFPRESKYRFHHMMKECAERSFETLDRELQSACLRRYGIWYEEHGLYIHAMSFYRRGKDFPALLEVIKKDAGILLSTFNPSEVLEFLKECPSKDLKDNPFSIPVLMRCMFNWGQIPKMLELKDLLMTAIEEKPDMDPVMKGNLSGECSLILSFLKYNDITAMSRLHRSASEQMTGTAISIKNSGGWTFGSPSVLMMFYRESGELKQELKDMDECMPYYYKITDGHGQGAEKIMKAEALFMQGKLADTEIALEGAYRSIEKNRQMNMVLCCDFLSCRLALFSGSKPANSFEDRYEELLKYHDTAQLNIWSAMCAYYYALTGEIKKIPEVFGEHRLSIVNLLAVGKPMHEMIENQVYLSQGDYAKVIGRSEGLSSVCEGLHYALVLIHIKIQTAAAYEMLTKHDEADKLLSEALSLAEPDGFLIPFAENYPYIRSILSRLEKEKDIDKEFIRDIAGLGESFEKGKEQRTSASRPEAFESLTEREYEIVKLMDKRLTNREIAERLFLSEGSVKQYINQIYSKLKIEGGRRTKRQQLFTLFL